MTVFRDRFDTAAWETQAAVSFQTLLALLFGVGWGAVFTAVFADHLSLNTGFGATAILLGAGVFVFLLAEYAAKILKPFLALELLWLLLLTAIIVPGILSRTMVLCVAWGFFCRLFGGEVFAPRRKKFALGVLWGGAAVLLWELPLVSAVVTLMMAVALFLVCSSLRYRKRTAFCGILLCFLFFWAEHHQLDRRLFFPRVANEAQGITLIAAAGLPECPGEPKALCLTSDDHAASVWYYWSVFNHFSVARPGRLMPWGKKYDLIFCDRPAAGESFRTGALLSRLEPGGVLALPAELAARWPHLKWQTLPGSNGSFAAARPDDPQWKIVPEKIDASLFRGKDRKSSQALSPGALEGMLIGFHSEKAKLPQTETVMPLRYSGKWAWGILLVFLFLHGVAFRRPKFAETLSIAENCFGFTLIMTLIFRSLPKCFEFLPMLLLFFFLYPLKIRNWLLKLIGTLAIAAALLWSLMPAIVLAVVAVLLSGAEFSTTFNEQMAEKPKAGGYAALLGLICAFLLAALAEHLPFAPMQIFQVALLFRVWTLIRC